MIGAPRDPHVFAAARDVGATAAATPFGWLVDGTLRVWRVWRRDGLLDAEDHLCLRLLLAVARGGGAGVG